MKRLRIIILALLAAVSMSYLIGYGVQMWRLWDVADVRPGWYMIDGPSLFLYREPDLHGTGQRALRFPLRFMLGDPIEGSRVFVRIPGWLPALPAIGLLAYAAFSLYQSKKRRVA